jgi:hydroxymethylglutaryl-CoA synthase
MCLLREQAHLKKNFNPAGDVETIAPGTYYLEHVDDMFRRQYKVKA